MKKLLLSATLALMCVPAHADPLPNQFLGLWCVEKDGEMIRPKKDWCDNTITFEEFSYSRGTCYNKKGCKSTKQVCQYTRIHTDQKGVTQVTGKCKVPESFFLEITESGVHLEKFEMGKE